MAGFRPARALAPQWAHPRRFRAIGHLQVRWTARPVAGLVLFGGSMIRTMERRTGRGGLGDDGKEEETSIDRGWTGVLTCAHRQTTWKTRPW